MSLESSCCILTSSIWILGEQDGFKKDAGSMIRVEEMMYNL